MKVLQQLMEYSAGYSYFIAQGKNINLLTLASSTPAFKAGFVAAKHAADISHKCKATF